MGAKELMLKQELNLSLLFLRLFSSLGPRASILFLDESQFSFHSFVANYVLTLD